jgi:hypothetical protein
MSSRKETVNIDSFYKDQAVQIAVRFPDFTEGCRVLFLIQRASDGGHTNNSKLRTYITRNNDEWIEALAKLLQEKEQYLEIPLRIYQTLNARNIEKGIRQYKMMQLEADYYDTESRHWFYLDARNRIVSALMRPNVAETSLFLIDVDTQGDEIVANICNDLQYLPDGGSLYVDSYATKNGTHIITKPFNPSLLKLPENCEMKKDAMMLLAF